MNMKEDKRPRYVLSYEHEVSSHDISHNLRVLGKPFHYQLYPNFNVERGKSAHSIDSLFAFYRLGK